MRRPRRPIRPTIARDDTSQAGSFFEPFSEVLDWSINLLLGMTYRAGTIRQQILVIVSILTWSLIAFTSHPIQEWQRLVFAVLDPASMPEVGSPVTVLVYDILKAYFSGDVLGHVIAVALPLWLALQFAAIFLDDIFELKDASIAEHFITRAAFTFPTFGIVHIENGDVRPSDRKSTIVKIGGPGRVRVSLENVAVFEKIDGTPELIGPTTGTPYFTRTLDGFERLRQIFDIRDLTMPIVDLYGRTKDGIPITVQNIRLLFSVQRDSSYTTLSRPYPYSQEAILRLVYDQAKGPWTNSITSLVRSELIRFISEHTLGEIFAAVGEPEVNKQISRQSIIQTHIWQHRNRSRRYHVLNQLRAQKAPHTQHPETLSRFPKKENPKFLVGQRPRRFPKILYQPDRWGRTITTIAQARIHYPHHPKTWQPLPLQFRSRRFGKKPRYPLLFRPELLSGGDAPNFVPRPQLSRRFYEQFAISFPNRASQRGVRLEWIDVGTWHPHPSASVVLDQHLEAYRLTAENMVRGDSIVLDELRRQGQANELIRLISRPIYRFVDLNRQQLERDEMVNQLIEEYLGTLRAARDQLLRDGVPLPDSLLPAIAHIQRYQRSVLQRNRARYI